MFSCNKACSKYHTRSTTTPKYTLPQHLVLDGLRLFASGVGVFEVVVGSCWISFEVVVGSFRPFHVVVTTFFKKVQDIHSRTFCLFLLRHPNKFPFFGKSVILKGVLPFSRGVIFTRTYLFRSFYNPWKKKYSVITSRKSIPFYLAKTSINSPYSQAAN